MVYVLSKEGKPLMPTKRHGKVRHMLRTGRAVVVQRTPFTIQLTYESTNYVQPLTLGIDAGSKTIGVSATTAQEEVYASETELRNDIVELLSTRREYRRARRNRKTRYRKARFQNRTNGKKQRWIAPSIQHKIETHLKVVTQAHKRLPISEIIAEVASFDIQKIKNPEISGAEYQQGEQLDFWNVREYVLFRDGHNCQYCHSKSNDNILNVHHIESRKTGGDAPNNLITLCEDCHQAYHGGKLNLAIQRGQTFKDAAFMGIMRWAFYNRLKETYPNVKLTYGYITKNTRIRAGLDKSHCVDARCISGNPTAKPSDTIYAQKSVRRHNRQIHKATINKGGVRKLNQSPKYVYGYQLFDKVKMANGEEGFIFGRRSSGSFDIRRLDGTKLSAGISYKKLKSIGSRRSILTERRSGVPPHN